MKLFAEFSECRERRTSGVQKDCAAELAAGELGADLRCLMPRQDLDRMLLVGVDVADDDDAVETSAVCDVDFCIAARHRTTTITHRQIR